MIKMNYDCRKCLGLRIKNNKKFIITSFYSSSLAGRTDVLIPATKIQNAYVTNLC